MGIGVTLLSRKAVPPCRLGKALRNALAPAVPPRQQVLGAATNAATPRGGPAATRGALIGALLSALRNSLGAERGVSLRIGGGAYPMKRDARGLDLSTDSAEAAALFDRAVEHYLKYHVDTMNLVNDALVPIRNSSWAIV